MDKPISPSIFAAMRTPLIAAGLTLFSLAQTQAEEEGGKLKKARDQVRPPSSSATSSSSGSSSSGQSHSSHSSQSSLHESSGWSLFDIFFGCNDTAPATYDRSDYSAPSYRAHSTNPSLSHGLLDYPYADGELGWFVSEKSSPVPKESLPPGVAPASKSEHLSVFGGAVRGEYTDCGDGLNAMPKPSKFRLCTYA